ncbi:hypothetical protein B0H13DRAFT_2342828 [Mycena leptocephala]|nr:hypothetical protein B0H13DRAFT_2342828 [Mycena leptocephala]
MSQSTNADPALPLDLERLIFEFAAEQYPSSIPTLLRVCQRVYAWLKPSLYRLLNLDHSPLVQAIQHGFESDSEELPARRSQTKESLLSRIFKLSTPPAAEIVEGSRAAFLKANVRHILSTMPGGYFDANREWQTITQLLHLNPSFFELAIKKYSSTALASSDKQLPKEIESLRKSRTSRVRLFCIAQSRTGNFCFGDL